MPFITDQGQQIFYREERPSPRASKRCPAVPGALVFIPGDTASSASLTGELRYFGHRYHALALDPPGTGRSQRLGSWPADWWGRAAQAGVALMKQLDLAPAVAVGSSDGSLAALLMAVEHPHLVCGVVADSCPPVLSVADLERSIATRRCVLTGSSTDGGRGVGTGHPGGALRGRLQRWSRTWLWRSAHGSDWRRVVAADADLRERMAHRGGLDLFGGRLATLSCPVLFTASSEDDLFADLGPRLESAAERMPQAQVFLWPEGGHPLMWTAPAAFRRAVDDFLSDFAGGADRATAPSPRGAAAMG